MGKTSNSETTDLAYKPLLKWGGVAALSAAVLTLGEVFLFVIFPQPYSVTAWFTLFQENKLIGLLEFWGLEVPMYIMFALVFLAFYFLLRKNNSSFMVIALIFALLGVTIFLATNNPFSMLSLGNQYAVASSDVERSTLLAAAQAVLANTNQRAMGGFNLGLFLVSVAGLIVSVVMLRSHSFSKVTAYVGILANALALADFGRQTLTSSAIVALLVILPNALFLVFWFMLAGRRLYRLGSQS